MNLSSQSASSLLFCLHKYTFKNASLNFFGIHSDCVQAISTYEKYELPLL